MTHPSFQPPDLSSPSPTSQPSTISSRLESFAIDTFNQIARPDRHRGLSLSDASRNAANDVELNGLVIGTPKNRSFSDSAPKLSPSPKIRERPAQSQDDNSIVVSPRTPRRTDFLARNLSLQMPPKSQLASPSTSNSLSRIPQSPQLDTKSPYSSPVTVLPRHSRGLDFSRACTNLHHSTLADKQSPDASPTVAQKGVAIPGSRSNRNSMILDSPNTFSSSAWGNGLAGDKNAVSSSLGSLNMLMSDSSSESSGEEDLMDHDDNDDPVIHTPQVLKLQNTTASSLSHQAPSPGGWPPHNTLPGASSFMNFQRRLRRRRSRKSSSSASGQSTMASPGPLSPSQTKFPDNTGGYFAREVAMRNANSRRESLSLTTNELHISSGNDSGDESGRAFSSAPKVVRRPVTKRSNLLPKSRAFGRIKADLLEESSPVDSEVRREAEIIRQVRENDDEGDRPKPTPRSSSSPSLPSVPGLDAALEDIPENPPLRSDGFGSAAAAATASTPKGLFGAFGIHTIRSAAAANNNKPWPGPALDTTNLPPFSSSSTHPSYRSSSANSEDIPMDSPAGSTSSHLPHFPTATASRTSTMSSTAAHHNQHQNYPTGPISAADGLRKSTKRRRDDDFDINSIKRRAVSPGVSVQNSPVLTQSPSSFWGGSTSSSAAAPPAIPPLSTVASSKSNNNKDDATEAGNAHSGLTGGGVGVGGQQQQQRSSSGSSLPPAPSLTPHLGPKRVGLQGMTDTNDGLMKMSIE